MSILINNLFLAPQDPVLAALSAKTKEDLGLLAKEVEFFLAGKIDASRARERLSPILKRLQSNAINRKEIKKHVFALANRVFLAGHPSLASFLISAFHSRVSSSKLAVLQQNFLYAKKLFEGTPYRNGYVASDGRILAKNGPGLNCITMNNILINLTAGARNYSERLAGDPNNKKETNEDIFTKAELIREGLYDFPIIRKFDANQIAKLAGLLKLYGNFFAFQLYSSEGIPFHAVFVYREGDKYRVMDTLAEGNVFADIGDLSALVQRYGSDMTYNINLVDTEQVRPVSQVKTKSFLLNLTKSIERAKKK